MSSSKVLNNKKNTHNFSRISETDKIPVCIQFVFSLTTRDLLFPVSLKMTVSEQTHETTRSDTCCSLQQFTLLPLAFFQTFLKLKQTTKSMYFHMSERFSSYCHFKIFSCFWFLCRDRNQELVENHFPVVQFLGLVSVLTVIVCIGSNLWSSAVYSVDMDLLFLLHKRMENCIK